MGLIFDADYRKYKKEAEKEKEQIKVKKELNSKLALLTKKRNEYAALAAKAKNEENDDAYRVYLALIKQNVFNVKHINTMLLNIEIADEMLKMNNVNKQFEKSFNSVSKRIQKINKSINVDKIGINFEKAIYSDVSKDLQNVLEENNIIFQSCVDKVSDIPDSEVEEFINQMKSEEIIDMDDSIEEFEQEFANCNPDYKEKEVVLECGPSQQKEETIINQVNEPSLNIETIDKKVELGPKKEEKEMLPEENYLENTKFNWTKTPNVSFDDIAGLYDVKEDVKRKVLYPLRNPELYDGYNIISGGGICLYGPPGSGKTMVACAIAHEIGGKFCSIVPSDLLQTGNGNTEKAVRDFFEEARKFPVAVVNFDEMDSMAPKNTKSTQARQLRSEFLAQLQGVNSYSKNSNNILLLICSTNKPWDIDSAFLRPGRFGTKIYVGLPDAAARKYMIERELNNIKKLGKVKIQDDVNVNYIVEKTNGFNGADVTNLLMSAKQNAALRCNGSDTKTICNNDFLNAFNFVHTSVQQDDIVKLREWKEANDK